MFQADHPHSITSLWICVLLVLSQLYVLCRIYPAVSRTSLVTAWKWAFVGWGAVAWLTVTRLLPETAVTLRAGLPEYVVGILLLAPLTSVLGARMPGSRVWTAFVVLPMVLVLAWPAVSQAWNSRGAESFELGTPATLGFLLVLLMGYGNYFGTGLTLPVTLYAASVIARIWSITGWTSGGPAPLIAESLLAVAGALALLRISRLKMWSPDSAAAAWTRLWITFRDLFGILWARRVMDRMNLFSAREQWAVELTLDGFVRIDRGPDKTAGHEHPAGQVGAELLSERELTESELRRPVSVLLWLLRRFVRPEWNAVWLGSFHGSADSLLADSGLSGEEVPDISTGIVDRSGENCPESLQRTDPRQADDA